MLTVSVIVPFFNSNVIDDVITRISNSLETICDYEIIIIDDGSKSQKWDYFLNKCRQTEKLKYLELTKNFGQHNAIIAGLSEAKYELIATLDDDLQNPPEELVKMINFFELGDFDLVYGFSDRPKHLIHRNLMSILIRLFLAKILRVKNVEKISSFRVFRKQIMGDFYGFASGRLSLDSVLNWRTGNIGFVKVEHNPRSSGKSNYNFAKLFSFALDTIIGYSVVPLKVATYIGLIISGLGFLFVFTIFFQYIVYEISFPGFTTVVSLVSILSGFQLIILGIIGEYLARMHLNIMRKPAFVVRRTIGIN
jgi:undecaprenyl-phosphate 4-deoxy-4-formamido-L-arabinose transferase